MSPHASLFLSEKVCASHLSCEQRKASKISILGQKLSNLLLVMIDIAHEKGRFSLLSRRKFHLAATKGMNCTLLVLQFVSLLFLL